MRQASPSLNVLSSFQIKTLYFDSFTVTEPFTFLSPSPQLFFFLFLICTTCSTAGGYSLRELQPKESPCWNMFTLKGCNLWEGPTLKWEESGRKKHHNGAVMDCPQPPIPHPYVLLRGEEVEESGMREWSWAWEGLGVGLSFLFIFLVLVCSYLFLINQVYFNWKWIKLIFLGLNLICPWH